MHALKTHTQQKKHPHMRGEDRPDTLAVDEVDRNTPTCVGKTLIHSTAPYLR